MGETEIPHSTDCTSIYHIENALMFGNVKFISSVYQDMRNTFKNYFVNRFATRNIGNSLNIL
jgi:hypothetical protein